MATIDPIRKPEKPDGDYAPSGERPATERTFSPDEIATAFNVAVERVHRAIAGEFGGAKETIDSRKAQQLAEVLLGDQPLDQREAALMTLGAYVPQFDHEWGLGDKPKGEESDRLVDTTKPDGERGDE